MTTIRPLWDRLVTALSKRPGHPPLATNGNPVQAWLDAAAIPWRQTRAELAARFGVHADNPYHWDLVSLDVQPAPLQAMLWPLGFQASARYAPAMPPATLSTHISIGTDAEANIRFAARQLAPPLGRRAITNQYNTRTVAWRWGAASVTLIVWPARLQSGPALTNPAHGRDPRLATACSLTIRTGWRPPLSPLDRRRLDSFVPLGPTRTWTPLRPRLDLGQTPFAETLLAFMRDPPDDIARIRGSFGISADALIICEDALYMIPLTQIAAFHVIRTLPGKGGGGSTLNARCVTGDAACPTKDVPVAQGEHADDLNDSAARLAAAAARPKTLAAYDYDV